MINKIKQLHGQRLNISQIARSLGVARSTVRRHLASDSPQSSEGRAYVAPWSSNINWPHVQSETKRGVPLSHYWEENINDKTEITYISFWREFKRRYPEIPIDMHKIYEPGVRCEIDFKGKDKEFGYVDPITKNFVACRLFGNILCFSQLFYCRATLNEKQESLFEGLARSYEYFGGVPETTICDNAKAQVIKAHRYDADLNPEFSLFCEFYKTAPIATRPSQPKDKNLIENALGIFWAWAWPKLRKKTYFSLGELNSNLLLLVNEFNNRIQKKYGMSRRQKFIDEKDKLMALPKTPYAYGEWSKHKAHADCHVQLRYNFYSVPYQLRGKYLDVRTSGRIIEVYSNLNRVAIHSNCAPHKGCYVTNREHLPEPHKAVLESTPQFILAQSEKIGPNTHYVIDKLICSSRHPLMYLRRCQGILRLKDRYSATQLERACGFFKKRNLTEMKIPNIEGIIKAGHLQLVTGKRAKRKANKNLRGQLTFNDFLKEEEQ